MHRSVSIGVAAATLLLVGLTGCATSGDMEALTARVAELEQRAQADGTRIGDLEGRFADVQAAADRSVERASEAEARARAAESRADDAARKADAIFRKSVSK
ncbi:MAG: Lpp/OprI family alanine-zipper lipoprotein [Myxococcota bacterium]